jgi:hypothetical protein
MLAPNLFVNFNLNNMLICGSLNWLNYNPLHMFINAYWLGYFLLRTLIE